MFLSRKEVSVNERQILSHFPCLFCMKNYQTVTNTEPICYLDDHFYEYGQKTFFLSCFFRLVLLHSEYIRSLY